MRPVLPPYTREIYLEGISQMHYVHYGEDHVRVHTNREYTKIDSDRKNIDMT